MTGAWHEYMIADDEADVDVAKQQLGIDAAQWMRLDQETIDALQAGKYIVLPVAVVGNIRVAFVLGNHTPAERAQAAQSQLIHQ